MWFLHDAELEGFETFTTENEAKEALEKNLEYWKEQAIEEREWPNYVENITIGEVKEISYLKPISELKEDGYTLEMKKARTTDYSNFTYSEDYPPNGIYLCRLDEDDEQVQIEIKDGKAFTEDGKKRIINGFEWKAI